WLVRRPSIRHRGRLQDLRRVLPRAGPPRGVAAVGTRGRRRCDRRVTTAATQSSHASRGAVRWGRALCPAGGASWPWVAPGARPTLTLSAGDGFLIPPRTPHNAVDVGPETGQMLSTYLVEAGQPLATFVAAPAA